MARGSMSVVIAVENFCVCMESRRRTAKTVGQRIMAVFAGTTDKKADARRATDQAFAAMEMNGTSARSVGHYNIYHHNSDKSHLKHIY